MMDLQRITGSSLVLATLRKALVGGLPKALPGAILGSLLLAMSGCASKTAVDTSEPLSPSTAVAGAASGTGGADLDGADSAVRRGPQGPLICKARKSKFRFDWQAASPNAAEGQFDQNSVSFDFKAASRPAGERGENLKVGECGWAAAPMVSPQTSKLKNAKSKNAKSSVPGKVTYKRLSEEATETFYKLRTGKVFKVPVRQGKNVLTVPDGAPVTIIR